MVSRALILLLFSASAVAQNLAFPTAEGFGRFSEGGRGGVVCHVDNLGDSASDGNQIPGSPHYRGSARYCMTNLNQPRTVVFDVGGSISLNSYIEMMSTATYQVPGNDDYVTVACHTAPGTNGVQFINSAIAVRASNVIMRYCKIRNGSGGGDAFSIGYRENVFDVILDHVSIGYGADETFEALGGRPGQTNVPESERYGQRPCLNQYNRAGQENEMTCPGRITIQNSLLHECLGGYDSNPGAGGSSSKTVLHAGVQEISWIKNMFLHAQRRHPLAYTNSIELIGNVHYNAVASGEEAMNFRPYWDSMTLSHVGSYFENGPVTTGLSWANISTSVSSNCSPSNWDCVANSAWFVSGNRQATLRPNDGLPETDIYTSWDGTREALRLLNVPGPEWTQPPFLTAEEYRDIVTDEENNPTKAAGACFPGNCDATDQRLHDDFDNKTGQLPDFFSDVPGGYPTYENAVRQAGYDSDWDGMPDTYEDANGLDKNNPNDGALVANGEAYYTNLELYLNGLVDEDSPAPPDPDTTPPQPPEGIIVSSLIALLGIGLGVLLFIGGRNHAFKPSH